MASVLFLMMHKVLRPNGTSPLDLFALVCLDAYIIAMIIMLMEIVWPTAVYLQAGF